MQTFDVSSRTLLHRLLDGRRHGIEESFYRDAIEDGRFKAKDENG